MLSRQSTVAKKSLSPKWDTEDVALRDAVNSWEQGTSETITVNGQSAPGTIGGGPHVGKPAFQAFNMKKSFADGGTMVAESENCVAFIPAGFRDGPTYNTMNPVQKRIGGPSALMSLVHVLTIPKKTRIFNACTLTNDHLWLLKEMRHLGLKATDILIKGPKDMPGSLQWVYDQHETITLNNGKLHTLTVLPEDLSPECRDNFKYKCGNIQSSFHVYPTASVGWLHLHTYVGDLLTTAHDTMEKESQAKYGQPKNTSYDDVINTL
jgi:hypothetical protein